MLVGDVCVGRMPMSVEIRRQLVGIRSFSTLLVLAIEIGSSVWTAGTCTHPEPFSWPPEVSTLINCEESQRIQTSVCVMIERMTKTGKHASNFFSSVLPLKSQEEEVGQTEIILRSRRTKHEIEGKTLLLLGSQSEPLWIFQGLPLPPTFNPSQNP